MLRSTTPRILVVDDDPAVIYAARALLAQRGCRVEAAFKGLDAVARARAGGLDAILLDLEMPDVDGLSALGEIAGLKNPPTVVLMADAPTAAARDAVALGQAKAILRKPVEFAHALVLVTGKIPEQPVPIRLEPTRAPYAIAREALDGKVLQLAEHVPLPAGTPINLILPHGNRKPIVLTGTAQRHAKALHIKLLPLTPTALAELGELLRRGSGNARPISKKQLAVHNRDGRGAELYQRGMRRLEQGRYAQALQDLAGARELTGKVEYVVAEKRAEQLAGAHRARTLIRRGRTLAIADPLEALSAFEEAIRLEPGRASTHLEAAQLLLQIGEDLERAEEHLGAAVHLAPSDPVPRLHLAGLLERAGRTQEALWATDAALALFPSDAELKQLAARLQRKLAGAPALVRGRRAI